MDHNHADVECGSVPSDRRRESRETDSESNEHFRPDLKVILQQFDPVTHQFRVNSTPPNLQSLPSTASTGRTSRSTSLLSRQQSFSTLPTQYETDVSQESKTARTDEQDAVAPASSSARATYGSDSSTSASATDRIEYVWNMGDESSQFGVSGARKPSRRRRNRRRSEVVVVHQGAHDNIFDKSEDRRDSITAPLSKLRQELIVLLAFIAVMNLCLTLAAYLLFRVRDVDARQFQHTLFLSTHVIAASTAAGMVVGKRPPSEALAAAVVILVVGQGVRSEFLEGHIINAV